MTGNIPANRTCIRKYPLSNMCTSKYKTTSLSAARRVLVKPLFFTMYKAPLTLTSRIAAPFQVLRIGAITHFTIRVLIDTIWTGMNSSVGRTGEDGMYVQLRSVRTLLDKLTIMIRADHQRSTLTFSKRRLQILFVHHREVTETVPIYSMAEYIGNESRFGHHACDGRKLSLYPMTDDSTGGVVRPRFQRLTWMVSIYSFFPGFQG